MNKLLTVFFIVLLCSCNKEPIALRDYKANSCFNLEIKYHFLKQLGLRLYKDDSGELNDFPTVFNSWTDVLKKRSVRLIGAIDTTMFKTHNLYLEIRGEEYNIKNDLISMTAWLDVESKEQIVYSVIDYSYSDQEQYGFLCYYWMLKPPSGFKIKRIYKYI